METATEILRHFNPSILIGQEDPGVLCGIEDIFDPFGRAYRIEYQSTLDGEHALAYCRYNPWQLGPNMNVSQEAGHLCDDGLLLLEEPNSSRPNRDVQQSRTPLSKILTRARYWCCAFSALQQSEFLQPQPEAEPKP